MNRTKQLENYIDYKIKKIISEAETGSGKKLYADLRRGVGKIPGDLPELWGSLFIGMPTEFYGAGTLPSKEEWACYISLTLYALHQQGFDTKKNPMHTEGVTLGIAFRKLVEAYNDPGAENRVLEKIRILSSANDIKEISYYLRSVIQLFRSKGIAIDYAKVGKDLFLLQSVEFAANVKLNWGRDFYRSNIK